MKNWTKFLSTFLALVMLFSLTSAGFAAQDDGKIGNVRATRLSAEMGKERKGFQSPAFQEANTYEYADEDPVRAIVIMEGEPVASGVSMFAIGGGRGRLLRQHKTLKNSMDSESIEYTVNFEYTTLLNGLSITVEYGDLESIADMDGVEAVYIANHYDLPDHDIKMGSSNNMTGLDLVQYYFGDLGSGTVVAVLDTGITLGHEAFQVYDGMLDEAVLDQEAVESALSGETGISEGQYVSQKIPFAYDYADQDDDPTDNNGHGTHVSGIAAGYAEQESEDGGKSYFMGSAPDAQILAMKIFYSDPAKRGTSSDIYFKALEDAYLLGADVINMSIGAQNGFTYDKSLETEVFGNIYQTLEDNGIICCISAGNEYSMAKFASNFAGSYGYVTSDYADYGTVASPSTMDGNLSVASVENAYYPTSYIVDLDGDYYEYYDSDDFAQFYNAMAGKTLEFVPAGYGRPEDFENIDVTGKVALISRGEISFQEKVTNAAQAGAAAVLVYNNEPGIIYMSISDYAVPAASLTQEAGQVLLDYYEQYAEIFEEYDIPMEITFPAEPVVVESPDGWLMSDFSNWGCTPDLTLKPQITGVGGNIYSASYNTTDGYELMSGTSMATPNLTGGMATLLGYLRDVYPGYDKAEYAKMAEALIESSATILTDDEGILYSPRKQGAGLMHILSAMSLPAYVTEPICNIGDSEEGVFTITFDVASLYDEEMSYEMSYAVLYDYLFNAGDLDEDGAPNYYNTLMSDGLTDEDVTITSNWPEDVVTVGAFDTVNVELTLTLSEDAKAYFDEVYPNGNFIEGYVELVNGYDNFHATFMGFYGDWTKAPVMETKDFRDIVDIETYLAQTGMSQMYSYTDFTEVNIDVNLAYLANLMEGRIYAYPGDNLFYFEDYDESRIAIPSPESYADAYIDTLYMLPMSLRNARHMIMVVSNKETGEVYYIDDTEYLPKAVYDTTSGIWQNTGSFMYDGTDLNGDPVANNTVVDVDYYANIPYGVDELDALIEAYGYEGLKAYAADYLEWNFDCTIDSQVPVISDLDYDEETGKLDITVLENQYLAAIDIFDSNFQQITGKGYADVYNTEYTDTFALGENKVVYIQCADYATNYSIYQLILDENIQVTAEVSPEEGGTVSGAGTYIAGQPVTLSAQANKDHRFAGWYLNDELISVDSEISFTASSDIHLVARFVRLYELLVINGSQQTKYQYAEGDTVILDPGATQGRKFLGWYTSSKDVVIENNSFVMPGHSIVVTAIWDFAGTITPGLPTPPSKPNVPSGGNPQPDIPAEPDVPAEEELPFVDISKSDWYYSDVEYVYANDLMSGMTDIHFSPDVATTRGMIVTILWRLEGEPGSDSPAVFTDVIAGAYYEKAVSWAAENGIVSGYSNDSFGPNDSITREQLASILFRYAQFKGYDVTASANLSLYTDAAEIEPYALDAMRWAVAQKLISGMDDYLLMPKGIATRAQFAAILHRFCENIMK